MFCRAQDNEVMATVLHNSATVNVNGSRLILSEVKITNISKLTTAVVSLDAENENGVRLYHVSGAALRQLSNGNKSILSAGDSAIYYCDIPWSEPEYGNRVRYVFTYNTGQSTDRRTMIEASLKEQKPIVLSAPVRGKNWAAIYNSAWQRGHRRVYYTVDGLSRIPGRFAIDFVQLDSNGRMYTENADFVNHYYGYGADVLAVDDGVVASLCNDAGESATISGHAAQAGNQASGNYLALQIRDGVYVIYEHLQPGSMRFKIGDRVKKGQVIARVGFTGDASEPHLHLHVANENSVLGAEGLPFVFEAFSYQGIFTDFGDFGKKRWSSIDSKKNREHTSSRPLPNSVISFPD